MLDFKGVTYTDNMTWKFLKILQLLDQWGVCCHETAMLKSF